MDDITTFEMLPDEMILLVSQYLRCGKVLYSFFNLNSRLNSTIADICHHVNISDVTYKQFDFIVSQIVPQIGFSIRSLVLNGKLESTTSNKVDSLFYNAKLSLIFPQLYRLSLVNFDDTQLDLFLDKITDLPDLVKLDFINLRENHGEGSLGKILAANKDRLKSVSFDSDSIGFTFNRAIYDEMFCYPNIKELTVNLKIGKLVRVIFQLVPHINRFHINCDPLSYLGISTSPNILPLVHLKDFQLKAIHISWSFNENS
ncbi:unnamed protein product [Rotaria socialis]|uniref:F-box domain-containing protein n=1 Tax=Rotaria socialis TaxID=392032 RepID=A0A818B8N8_9BILA|nr:unnamed protein product [Rotaria socialis]CAF4846052.1 unnamed protein product [Rotaria socialis]